MKPTTAAEAEASALQVQTIANFVLSQVVRHGPLHQSLNFDSFGGDADMDGEYDDTTGEWRGYLLADTDAMDGGNGLAP